MIFAFSKVIASEIPNTANKFLSPDEAFIITHEIVNNNHLRVNWLIHPGYYLYMGMFEFKSLDEDNKIQKVKMPEGEKKTDEFFGEVDIYYYSVSADVYLWKNVSDTIELKIKYQGCADAGLCYPPSIKIYL